MCHHAFVFVELWCCCSCLPVDLLSHNDVMGSSGSSVNRVVYGALSYTSLITLSFNFICDPL